MQKLIFSLSIAALTLTSINTTWAAPQKGSEYIVAEGNCDRAQVSDSTPLNVRNQPSGPQKLGSYANGAGVRIEMYALDAQKKIWAFVSPDSRENKTPQGWVSAEKLKCEGGGKASDTTVAKNARAFPQPDSQGNYKVMWDKWLVVDRTGPLKCRKDPGTTEEVVRTFNQGDVLTMATGSSTPFVLDATKAPWLSIEDPQTGRPSCVVRGNKQFVVPF